MAASTRLLQLGRSWGNCIASLAVHQRSAAITNSEAEETAARSALAIFNLLLCLFAAAAAAVAVAAAAAGRSGHVQFMKLRGFWRPDF